MNEQIGRYKVLKQLGEGAMAVVYLAEFETGIGFKRKVALKVVRPEFAADKKFIALMGREAMIGSMLQHPNIVQTLEFDEADGRSFLALEYVEGQTLGDLLDARRAAGQGGLPLIVALEAMVQVLKGLSYAHNLRSPEDEAMDIVHRDLKPGNIMLSQYGLVKVMDFGIAKARIATANITTVGQVRGTPIYMAPEQVTGRDLDGRSDQFAAATVLYELLTGEQLFIDNNLIRIMQRVARAEVDEQIDEVRALHPGLAPILQRMWARDAADRFADCEDAARLIEDVVFEIKANARRAPEAAAPASAGPERARGPASHPPHDDIDETRDEAVAPSGLFSGLTEFVRRLFGGAKPVAAKKRKRKKRRVEPSAAETISGAAPVAGGSVGPRKGRSAEATPAKEPTPNVALLSPATARAAAPRAAAPPPVAPPKPAPPPKAAAPPKPAPPPVAPPVADSSLDLVFEEASSSDFNLPAAPDPADRSEQSTQPPRKSTPLGPETGGAREPAADRSGEGLDPFFFENFDE